MQYHAVQLHQPHLKLTITNVDQKEEVENRPLNAEATIINLYQLIKALMHDHDIVLGATVW